MNIEQRCGSPDPQGMLGRNSVITSRPWNKDASLSSDSQEQFRQKWRLGLLANPGTFDCFIKLQQWPHECS